MQMFLWLSTAPPLMTGVDICGHFWPLRIHSPLLIILPNFLWKETALPLFQPCGLGGIDPTTAAQVGRDWLKLEVCLHLDGVL